MGRSSTGGVGAWTGGKEDLLLVGGGGGGHGMVGAVNGLLEAVKRNAALSPVVADWVSVALFPVLAGPVAGWSVCRVRGRALGWPCYNWTALNLCLFFVLSSGGLVKIKLEAHHTSTFNFVSCVNLDRNSRCIIRTGCCYPWSLGTLTRPDPREEQVRWR